MRTASYKPLEMQNGRLDEFNARLGIQKRRKAE